MSARREEHEEGRLLVHTDQWTSRRPSEERLAL